MLTVNSMSHQDCHPDDDGYLEKLGRALEVIMREEEAGQDENGAPSGCRERAGEPESKGCVDHGNEEHREGEEVKKRDITVAMVQSLKNLKNDVYRGDQ